MLHIYDFVYDELACLRHMLISPSTVQVPGRSLAGVPAKVFTFAKRLGSPLSDREKAPHAFETESKLLLETNMFCCVARYGSNSTRRVDGGKG